MISLALNSYFRAEFSMCICAYILKLAQLQNFAVVFVIVTALVRYMSRYSTVAWKKDQENLVRML